MGVDTSENVPSKVSRNYGIRMVSLGVCRFDMAIGVVIVINSLTIGAEIQTELMNRSTLLYAILEYVYTFIYTGELGLRFFVYGAACLISDWVIWAQNKEYK